MPREIQWNGYGADLTEIFGGTLLWAGVVVAVLQLTGSKLVGQILRRRS